MAALSSGRNTPLKGEATQQAYSVEANTVIYLGSIVVLNDNGNAIPATAKTGAGALTAVPRVVGVANNVVSGDIGQDCHNVSGYPMIPSPSNLGSAGALSINTAEGVFRFDNDVTNPASQATVGKIVYAVDDHTVGTSNLTTTLASVGTVVQVDSLGVWVNLRTKSLPAT